MESNPTRRGLTHRNKMNYLKKQRHAGKFQIYFLVSRYKFLENSIFHDWNNKEPWCIVSVWKQPVYNIFLSGKLISFSETSPFCWKNIVGPENLAGPILDTTKKGSVFSFTYKYIPQCE